MKTKRPEKALTELELDDISGLRGSAAEELNELLAIKDEDITDEQLADITELVSIVAELDGEVSGREQAAQERADRIAAARAAGASAAEKPAEKPEDKGDGEDPDKGDGDEPKDSEKEAVEKPEVVTASGGRRSSIVAKTGRTSSAVVIDKPAATDTPAAPQTSLVAAAGVPNVAQGSRFDNLMGVAEAFGETFGNMPSFRSPNTIIRNQVAKVHTPSKTEFSLDQQGDYDSVEGLFKAAADERRLPGNSLVAAGGWCAPSETVWDMPELETVDGILDMPEVTWGRGGIEFTQGPDFAADIYDHADFGFTQTETQAEAGLEKPILQVECIDWDEVRLDAFGYGISAGILTNKTFPELIQRYLRGGAVAHAHRMNAITITRVAAQLAAFDATSAFGLGSTAADSLNALAFVATRARYRHRLGENATLEGFAPIWFKETFRADLAHRLDVSELAVTDAQIDAWLAARKIRLQWVYDWQSLTATSVKYPNQVQVALYPAGTFVKGVNDVISLDAVYDSVNIRTNNFLAIFFEEAMAIAKLQTGGDLVTLPTVHLHGRTGAGDITDKAAAA